MRQLILSVIYATLLSVLSVDAIMIIGHRGACGYEPENTLASFQCAIDMGVDMIELDVYVCATGELVVIHDPGVALRAMPGCAAYSSDCAINKQGNVVDMTFDQLRSLVVGGKEKIPTLEEAIDLLDRKVPLNIELKGPRTAQPVAELLKKYLQRGWKADDFVVSSFDCLQIDTFHQVLPSIQTGVLFSTSIKDKIRQWVTGWVPDTILECVLSSDAHQMVQCAQRHHASFIGVGVDMVNGDIVQAAHLAGFPVFVWTVNDKKTADKLRAMQINGIFSNYPDIVR